MPVLKSLFNLSAAALLGLLSLTAQADSSLIHYSLKNLRSADSESTLAEESQVATIAMIFQPDCPWCKKQGKLLSQLQYGCSAKLNLTLVGTKGDRQSLKRELRHFDRSLSALQADSQFLRLAGGIQAAPTTLFFDKNGKLLLKKRGYIQAKTLFVAAGVISGQSCQLN